MELAEVFLIALGFLVPMRPALMEKCSASEEWHQIRLISVTSRTPFSFPCSISLVLLDLEVSTSKGISNVTHH